MIYHVSDYIAEKLSSEDRKIALDFVGFLESKGCQFIKDNVFWKEKIIFGKRFNNVCGCTFRFDNPDGNDINALKRVTEIQIKRDRASQIDNSCSIL